MGKVIQGAFKELAEDQYKYHSKREWTSGLMKFNPECGVCLAIKGERIYNAAN